jgi:hypothetical protein
MLSENAISDKGAKYDLKGLAASIEIYDAEEYDASRRVQ